LSHTAGEKTVAGRKKPAVLAENVNLSFRTNPPTKGGVYHELGRIGLEHGEQWIQYRCMRLQMDASARPELADPVVSVQTSQIPAGLVNIQDEIVL
jgi:hypothetical protein